MIQKVQVVIILHKLLLLMNNIHQMAVIHLVVSILTLTILDGVCMMRRSQNPHSLMMEHFGRYRTHGERSGVTMDLLTLKLLMKDLEFAI